VRMRREAMPSEPCRHEIDTAKYPGSPEYRSFERAFGLRYSHGYPVKIRQEA
jgi:hypothetical protein